MSNINKIMYTCMLSIGLICVVKAQRYNTIIPTDFGNVNAPHFYWIKNKLCVFGLYGSENKTNSVLIINSDNKEIDYVNFESFAVSSDPFQCLSNRCYVYGKNRQRDKALLIGRFSNDWDLELMDTVATPGYYNFPNGITSINNSLYTSYYYDEHKIGVSKYSAELEEIWSYGYETDHSYTYLWNFKPSHDNHLMLGYSQYDAIQFNTDAYLSKVDTNGQVVWQSEAMEKVDGGATPVIFAELSNGNFVVGYRADMHRVYEFAWHLVTYPPIWVILDSDGKIIEEDIWRLQRTGNVYFGNVKTGKGDYYFAYGTREYANEGSAGRDYYGFVTKYSNEGDTIWSRQYRHPAYDAPAIDHSIRDLIEHDDGTLSLLGSITPIGQKTEVWLLGVDSNGCLNPNACEEKQIVTSTVDSELPINLKLYPNPSDDFIYLDGIDVDQIDHMVITNLEGKSYPVVESFSDGIDINHLDRGVYILHIRMQNGAQSEVCFIKL